MKALKVLVVGAGEAGKSTLIQALCPQAINLEVNGRTVAMDQATLDRNGSKILFIGVPGQKRFAAVREALAEGAKVAVWVHRAGEPVDQDTQHLVAELVKSGAPYFVFVNHHADDVPATVWPSPPGFVQPDAVISDDLLNPKSSLIELQVELWRIVEKQFANAKGTRKHANYL